MFCAKCGSKASEDDDFCRSCGSRVSASRQSEGPAESPIGTQVKSNSGHHCPVCNSIDTVRKVSSIRSVATSGTIGQTTMTGASNPAMHHELSTSSTLVQRLTPPRGPWEAKELGYSSGIGCSGLAGAFSLLAIAYNAANPSDNYPDGNPAAIWFAVFTFVMAMIFVGTMIAKSRSSSERERQKEAWTQGELRLANAWYCERDDVLFDDALHAVPEGFIAEAFRGMWPRI